MVYSYYLRWREASTKCRIPSKMARRSRSIFIRSEMTRIEIGIAVLPHNLKWHAPENFHTIQTGADREKIFILSKIAKSARHIFILSKLAKESVFFYNTSNWEDDRKIFILSKIAEKMYIEKFKNIGREKKMREFALATISYFQTTATAEPKS